jgi:hypothetical protein
VEVEAIVVVDHAAIEASAHHEALAARELEGER